MTKRVGQLRVEDVESRLRLTRKGRAHADNINAKMMADPRRMTYVGFQTDRLRLARHGSGLLNAEDRGAFLEFAAKRLTPLPILRLD